MCNVKNILCNLELEPEMSCLACSFFTTPPTHHVYIPIKLTREGPFSPGWSQQPGQKTPLVRVGVTNRCYHPGLNVQSLLSRLEPPTGTKGGPFVPVSASNRDKRPLSSRWPV